jgi:hypothetical protein
MMLNTYTPFSNEAISSAKPYIDKDAGDAQGFEGIIGSLERSAATGRSGGAYGFDGPDSRRDRNRQRADRARNPSAELAAERSFSMRSLKSRWTCR